MSIPAFLNRLCCGFVEEVTCLGVAEEAETFQPQLWRRLPDYFRDFGGCRER